MTNGPLQLVVIGFEEAALPEEFVHQLRKLRETGIVRLVDATFVSKDEQGELAEIRVSDLSQDEAILLGTLAGALFGYGAVGDAGIDTAVEFCGLAAEQGEYGIFTEDMNQVADLIPRSTAVIMILLEHVWAIGLKESVQNSNGIVIANGWITPATLLAMGQLFPEEAVAIGWSPPG